ncbi:MAG TPA: ATP-binding protein [Solirubrobacteraceae bacterium]|nr:ATP-binding protein [Solirubrobacteraceae bacterium]
MSAAPNVRLALTNLPENVSLVREVLAGLAGVVPLEDGQLDDVKTVVSEACNNVVLHAYDGALGPLDVEIRVADGTLEVTVRDRGGGLRPRLGRKGELEGIGIPVIHALSDRVEFTGGIGEGTQVRMHFNVPDARGLGPAGVDPRESESDDLTASGPPAPDEPGAAPEGAATAPPSVRQTTATLDVAPLSLARSVLSRPLTALAARARFSIDRLSDVQLVTDAIAAHAGRSLQGIRLKVVVATATRDLRLRIGPLLPGSATQLVGDSAVGGLQPLIEALADEVAVETDGDSEILMLRLLDTR